MFSKKRNPQLRFGSYSKLLFGLVLLITPQENLFADPLPYSARTLRYNGFSPTTFGDIRTVGMSGATVGLADTFIATLDNPAGLALTMIGADSNFSSDTIYDGSVQNIHREINVNNFGLSLNNYPWGFSIGYVLPYREGQEYTIPTTPNDEANLRVTVREFHASVAHLFFNNRLSLGLGLILGQAEDQITFKNGTFSEAAYHPYIFSGTLGASYRINNHLVLGLGYHLPQHYPSGILDNRSLGLTNFFQGVDVPARIGLGLGWIPNRFFRADITTFFVDSATDTALIRSEDVRVGERITIQPRAGAAYTFLNIKDLQGTGFVGSYYEVSRIQNAPNRLHGSIGMEFKIWLFTTGLGWDTATDYNNFITSVGVDLIKVLEKIDVIPTLPHSPYAGVFPKVIAYSEEGLPAAMVTDGKPKPGGVDPIKIGLQVPKRFEERATEIFKPEEAKKEKLKKKKEKAKKKKQKQKAAKNTSQQKTESESQ